MKNHLRDGRTVSDLLENALEASLARKATADALPTGGAGCAVAVGEIIDTHHPHLPSRVLVRWWPSAEKEESAWLHHERHLTLRKGDRVLVTLPLGWSEWVVTGALSRAAAQPNEGGAQTLQPAPDRDAGAAVVQLEPGQSVSIIGSDGAPLLRVQQGPQGPIVQLEGDQVELQARRRLRLAAGTVEIAAGQGGVEVRTDGDAVVRAHAIRLN